MAQTRLQRRYMGRYMGLTRLQTPKFNIGDKVQTASILPEGWMPWANQIGTVTEVQGVFMGPDGLQRVYIVHSDVMGDMTLYENELTLVTPATPTTGIPMISSTLSKWLPMGPQYGPPFPKFLNIYWPWVKTS